LVADDNESARYHKVRTLRRAGYEVIEAASGEEALRAAADSAPRLIVLDINLPDVDGREVARRLKADERTSSIVILQVSATHVRQEDTVMALDSGADASLTEPMEPAVLVATVRALLRARLAEDTLRDTLGREQVIRAAAEAANRTKDEFLATLSHELRTPLGAILGWTRLLRSRKLDEPAAARALETIERNAKLQSQLVEDLLDVSRIITGKLRLETRPVDLFSLIEGAVETVRPAAEAKAIRLETTLDSPGGLISGDPDRLLQVIWNLLSNAIKFTPREGRVEVRLGREGAQVTVQVRDTGKGITPEFLPHIFDRFRQADSTTTRAHGGLGLGLAIVRHLVELHGGTVEAASPGEGGGAIFTVALPLASVEATGLSVTRDRDVADDTSLEGVHVLVVDDDVDARESLVMVLKECGAEVVAVSSAREALKAVGRVVPDVLVSDIAMPEVDGYGLLRRLRALPVERPVPALALTAYAGEDHRRRALAAGFEMHLAKPIDPGELAAAVRSLAGLRPTDRP
ncbi:MAG TPA: response regulator, partial [Candidatus Nitrosopolaris sp.]|nr:response regulator [Candidatus Nitrosopolaris sp.]